jgi:hypothetical protein
VFTELIKQGLTHTLPGSSIIVMGEYPSLFGAGVDWGKIGYMWEMECDAQWNMSTCMGVGIPRGQGGYGSEGVKGGVCKEVINLCSLPWEGNASIISHISRSNKRGGIRGAPMCRGELKVLK